MEGGYIIDPFFLFASNFPNTSEGRVRLPFQIDIGYFVELPILDCRQHSVRGRSRAGNIFRRRPLISHIDMAEPFSIFFSLTLLRFVSTVTSHCKPITTESFFSQYSDFLFEVCFIAGEKYKRWLPHLTNPWPLPVPIIPLPPVMTTTLS